MKLKLHGVRGSRPTHKRNLLGYGGNSTSFEILTDESDDYHIFIDGGSGLAKCGRELGETPDNKKFHMLVTHTHWDHILGYPMFKPMYNQNNSFTFYSSSTSKADFNDLFFGLSNAQNLPVPPSSLKAKVDFLQIFPEVTFEVEDKYKVRSFQLNHQGITLGYRVECEEDSVAIITDCAPIENNYLGEGMAELAAKDPKKFEQTFLDGLVNFLDGCNTVVFDTHFTEKNLKPDWGHSTPERALEIAKKAHVSRLILFHHSPEDADADVDNKVSSVITEAINHGIELVAAKEGDIWDLR